MSCRSIFSSKLFKCGDLTWYIGTRSLVFRATSDAAWLFGFWIVHGCFSMAGTRCVRQNYNSGSIPIAWRLWILTEIGRWLLRILPPNIKIHHCCCQWFHRNPGTGSNGILGVAKVHLRLLVRGCFTVVLHICRTSPIHHLGTRWMSVNFFTPVSAYIVLI